MEDRHYGLTPEPLSEEARRLLTGGRDEMMRDATKPKREDKIMENTRELCSCGNPQSYPVPHEHDRTDRKKQIIKHYEGISTDLYEALKWVTKMASHSEGDSKVILMAEKALAKAKGK